MGRAVQTAILLLIVVALFTVLVTPDPSDDVKGVLHKIHLELAVLLHCVHLQHVRSDPGTIAAGLATLFRKSLVSELLDLNCARLC